MQNKPQGAASKPLYLWRSWNLNQLPQALKDCRSWEQDAQRHGFGEVQLVFRKHAQTWVVLVSQELVEAELPF